MRFLRWFRVPPDCREVADVLQAFLDGELPPSKTHLVTEHLEHCERCGIEAEVYETVKRSLAQLAVPPDRLAMRRLRSFADSLGTDETS
jgi:anti-sigma factor (TIGR02949 family)